MKLLDPYDDCPQNKWMLFDGDYETYVKFHIFHTDGQLVEWHMDYKEIPRSYCLSNDKCSRYWMKSFFRDQEEGEDRGDYYNKREIWAEQKCKDLQDSLKEDLLRDLGIRNDAA